MWGYPALKVTGMSLELIYTSRPLRGWFLEGKWWWDRGFLRTLWLCQNSYWKLPFIVDLPIDDGWFYIVMLVYQRVCGASRCQPNFWKIQCALVQLRSQNEYNNEGFNVKTGKKTRCGMWLDLMRFGCLHWVQEKTTLVRYTSPPSDQKPRLQLENHMFFVISQCLATFCFWDCMLKK